VGVVPPFVGVAVKVTLVPARIVPLGLADIDTEGMVVGLTVNVKVVGVPVQVKPDELLTGVTVMVETIADAVLFVAVKAAIFPVPLAAKPVAVLVFDHM
jgi:hypothetical protein